MPRSVGSSSGWTAGAGDVVAAADEVLAGAGFDDDPHPQATNRTATPLSAAAISRGRIGTETTGTARPPSSGTVEPGIETLLRQRLSRTRLANAQRHYRRHRAQTSGDEPGELVAALHVPDDAGAGCGDR